MRFHSEKALLFLFWIILIGLFWFLIKNLPKMVKDIVIILFVIFFLIAIIKIFLDEIFEIDIFKKFKGDKE